MNSNEHDDSKLREQIALFRYGLIADLLHLPDGKKGLYKRLNEKAEREPGMATKAMKFALLGKISPKGAG